MRSTILRRLLVLGAGPIGCELAQAFAGLGSAVTVVTHDSRIMPREDVEVSERVAAEFAAQGIEVLTDAEPQSFVAGSELRCRVQIAGSEREIIFDRLLLAVGRSANVEGIGLEELGIGVDAAGRVEVDDYLRTVIPTIYAAGDVAGPYLFTHMASHQAWYAAVNALLAVSVASGWTIRWCPGRPSPTPR